MYHFSTQVIPSSSLYLYSMNYSYYSIWIAAYHETTLLHEPHHKTAWDTYTTTSKNYGRLNHSLTKPVIVVTVALAPWSYQLVGQLCNWLIRIIDLRISQKWAPSTALPYFQTYLSLTPSCLKSPPNPLNQCLANACSKFV